MKQISEGLRPKDLEDLIIPVFDVDTYKSMMGDDENVLVLSFEVKGNDSATDVVNFIEKGYEFVLDADTSEGETENNNFKVYVELERDRKAIEHINDIIYGLSELSNIKDWRFRYYKDYHSNPIEDLKNIVPTSAEKYREKIESVFEDDIRFFFRKSPLDYVVMENDIFTFKRSLNNPIKMKLLNYGTRTDLLSNLKGTIRIDETSTSETLWLTKYFGDYNITKYDDYFVFENDSSVFVFNLIK